MKKKKSKINRLLKKAIYLIEPKISLIKNEGEDEDEFNFEQLVGSIFGETWGLSWLEEEWDW